MAKKKMASTASSGDRRLLKLLGNRIREIRQKKDLSVYDITGEDMPVRSRQHWQAIENGQKNVNIITIFKVARTLEVRVDELIKDIV